MPKQCYLVELHQQLEKVVKSNPTSRATVMEDEAEDPKVIRERIIYSDLTILLDCRVREYEILSINFKFIFSCHQCIGSANGSTTQTNTGLATLYVTNLLESFLMT